MALIYTDFWVKGMKLDIIEKIIKYYNIKVKKNILIYSGKGKNHSNNRFNDFLKIFYTGESNHTAKEADYIIGFLPTKGKYIRLTNYERLEKSNDLDYKIYHSLNLNWKSIRKTKFCCFIVTNGACEIRNNFYNLLNTYKKVDSLGKYKNNCDILTNISRKSKDYYDIISQYKFIICFENKSNPYYLTEKIYNAFISNIVPIYWGDPNVTDIFNKETFINVKNTDCFSKTIELIQLLDNNEELYNNYFKEKPVLNPNVHDRRVDNSISKIYNLLTK